MLNIHKPIYYEFQVTEDIYDAICRNQGIFIPIFLEDFNQDNYTCDFHITEINDDKTFQGYIHHGRLYHGHRESSFFNDNCEFLYKSIKSHIEFEVEFILIDNVHVCILFKLKPSIPCKK